MRKNLFIKNGVLVPLGHLPAVLEGVGLLTDGEVIARIAPVEQFASQIEPQIQNGSVDVIDAAGKVVMPGFINAHTHFYSQFARGLSKVAPSKDFIDVLKNLWWRLDRKLRLEDCYFSALVSLMDCVRHGTTTVFDHHSSPSAIRGSLEKLAMAVEEVGLRASLCYEVSDRDGKKAAEEGILENESFIQSVNASKSTSFGALFGLHASFTLSEKTLRSCAESAGKLGAGFHVHAAESASDEKECQRKWGCRVGERFAKRGVLGPRSLLAHGVHLNAKEIRLLSKNKTQLVHNPTSNLNNGVGALDLLRAMDAGVRVCLGSDAMTNHMPSEMRSALWLARHLRQNPSVGWTEVGEVLLQNNPKWASDHFGVRLGCLEEGAAADLILIDYKPPTPLNADSWLGHLVFGLAEGSVDTTIARGRVLMRNRLYTLPFDEEEVIEKSRRCASRLWARF